MQFYTSYNIITSQNECLTLTGRNKKIVCCPQNGRCFDLARPSQCSASIATTALNIFSLLTNKSFYFSPYLADQGYRDLTTLKNKKCKLVGTQVLNDTDLLWTIRINLHRFTS